MFPLQTKSSMENFLMINDGYSKGFTLLGWLEKKDEQF